jgi:hypothetical protein
MNKSGCYILLGWIRIQSYHKDPNLLQNVPYLHPWLFCQEPVEKWPICDCLIAFHSRGFPLQKSIAYAKLRWRKIWFFFMNYSYFYALGFVIT